MNSILVANNRVGGSAVAQTDCRYTDITNLNLLSVNAHARWTSYTRSDSDDITCYFVMEFLVPNAHDDQNRISVAAEYRLSDANVEVFQSLKNGILTYGLHTDAFLGRVSTLFTQSVLAWIEASCKMDGFQFFNLDDGTRLLVDAVLGTM